MKVLRRIEDMAAKHGLPIIGPEKGKVLTDAIIRYNPSHILEVGTNIGYSAILMCQHFRGRVTTIEIDPRTAKIAEENIKQAGLSDRITIYVGHALDVIPHLEETYDMLFLDAVKEEYHEYLQAAEPKMARNAVIVADNVGIFEAQMKDYLEYVRHSGRFQSWTYDFGYDAVEVSETA